MRQFAMLVVCLAIAHSSARADDVVAMAGAPAPSAAGPSVAAPAPAPQPVEPLDGMRIRNGISLSFGEAFGSGPSSGLTETLTGADWRIGAQVNNLYAVYLATHLSFGSASFGGTSGTTGNFAAALMGERMIDKFAAGAGVGYGVLNNPSGPLAQIHAAWYPMMSTSVTEARRRGLMVGVDARWYFAGDQIGTVTQLSVGVGYEKF
jgi:hypothetical protein